MKIQQNVWVELELEVRGSEEEEFTKEDEMLSFVHGHGFLPPALEQNIEGKEEGDALEVTLSSKDAFGDYDPGGILAIPRGDLPPDAEIVPGDFITANVEDEESGESEEIDLRVVEINPDAITVDANHPLAGQAVTFRIIVLGVREASEDELAGTSEAGTSE